MRKVFQDRDGHYWFGTNSEGVCRYDGKALTYFGVREGFGGSAVRGIVQDNAGAMWFATEGGVSRYESGKFTNSKVGIDASDSDLWSMLLDKSGTLWAGTLNGVRRFDGTSFVSFPLPRVAVENPQSRFSPLVVFSMAEDLAGNLWFGTDGEGVHKYNGKSFTTYTTKDGLGGNQVRALYVDRRGRIWAGTDGGGVSCFDGAAIRTFTAKDGLNNDRVFGVLEDSAGNMWFSTLGAGACRYDGKTFTPFREENGLTRSHVQSMHEDRDGTLWFGCSGGLFRFDGKSFINVTRNGPWPAKAQGASKITSPMASFAGMVPGAWKRTFSSGSSMIATWHWGPSQHSMREMTEGFAGDGQPWHEVRVFYWHPGRQQVCVWGVSPFAQGVSEGTISFDSRTAEGVFDVQQFGFDPNKNGGRRKLGLRWTFDGPDMYRDVLLEDTGKGFETLAEWDHFRINPPAAPPRANEVAVPRPSDRMKAFEPLLASTWEGHGKLLWGGEAAGQASRIQTTFEWTPYAEAIYARTLVLTDDGEPTHLLDAYIHHYAGTNSLRCRAFTKSGGVYEGGVTMPAEHSLQLDLKGYEGERVVSYVARFEFEKDGAARHRIWSAEGNERTLLLDIHHRKLEPKED